MHTPTKAQMQVVIDNLKKVLPLATRDNHLLMSCSEVNKGKYKCGTIHCFGGWYAVAVCAPHNNELDYSDGVIKIAEHLGFEQHKRDSVKQWAWRNPTLWGNPYGIAVFNEALAFYNIHKRPYGALSLQDIIDHLEEVRDRLPV